MARRTKLNAETQEAILEALRFGATYRDASEAAGIDYSTFWRWMREGEKANKGKFRDFYEAVKRTEAETRVKLIRKIAEAAERGDWRAALELLKRRYREDWGDNIGLNTDGMPAITIYLPEKNNKNE